MAVGVNGEDWDREAHVGHMFNDEELKQMNGYSSSLSVSLSLSSFSHRSILERMIRGLTQEHRECLFFARQIDSLRVLPS